MFYQYTNYEKAKNHGQKINSSVGQPESQNEMPVWKLKYRGMTLLDSGHSIKCLIKLHLAGFQVEQNSYAGKGKTFQKAPGRTNIA